METLRKFLNEACGRVLARKLVPNIRLFPIDNTRDQAFLFGSRAAARKPYLIRVDEEDFIRKAAPGYFLVGHWGHGINTYDLYYSLVDAQRRIFFRLGYGGVYMDNEQRSGFIRRFLSDYFAFEADARGRYESLVAVEIDGVGGFYRVKWKGRRTSEHDNPMFTKPEFRRHLIEGAVERRTEDEMPLLEDFARWSERATDGVYGLHQ